MLQFSWNRIPNIDYLLSRRINIKICFIIFFVCVDRFISLYNTYKYTLFDSFTDNARGYFTSCVVFSEPCRGEEKCEQ